MDNLVCAGIVIIAVLLFVYILCNSSLRNKNKRDNKENFQAKYPFKYNKICGKWPSVIKTGRRPGNSESRVRY